MRTEVETNPLLKKAQANPFLKQDTKRRITGRLVDKKVNELIKLRDKRERESMK